MLSFTSIVKFIIIRILTHPLYWRIRRACFDLVEVFTGRSSRVFYFHEAGDPQSQLCLQIISEIEQNFRVTIIPFLVSPPEDDVVPERILSTQWAHRDSQALARYYGLNQGISNSMGGQQSEVKVHISNQGKVHFSFRGATINNAPNKADKNDGPSVFPFQSIPRESEETAIALGVAMRRKLGHYSSAAFYHNGEWYIGVDRLHYLFKRLRKRGLSRGGALSNSSLPCEYPPPELTQSLLVPTVTLRSHARPILHFFCSFRSPYTYLAISRVRALAAQYGAALELRFVLPMVLLSPLLSALFCRTFTNYLISLFWI